VGSMRVGSAILVVRLLEMVVLVVMRSTDTAKLYSRVLITLRYRIFHDIAITGSTALIKPAFTAASKVHLARVLRRGCIHTRECECARHTNAKALIENCFSFFFFAIRQNTTAL